MSSSSSSSSSPYLPAGISPSQARELNTAGATLLLLGFPVGSQLGLDYLTFTTAEKFKGVKMIPPGPHLLHYTAANDSSSSTTISLSDAAILSSANHAHCWLWVTRGEVIVRRWSSRDQTFVSLSDKDEESRYILGVKNYDFDASLGPYPLIHWARWRQLAYPLNQTISEQIERYRVREETKFRSKYHITDKQPQTQNTSMSTEMKVTEEKQRDEVDNDKMNIERQQQQREPSRRRNPFPSSPTVSYYTNIPPLVIPPNASASDITAMHLDRSHQLELFLQQLQSVYPDHVPHLSLIAEFSHAFLSFVIAEEPAGFNHWKEILILLCQCDAAFNDSKYHPLFIYLFQVLAIQVNEIPEDFFIDPLSDDNFIEHSIEKLLTMVDETKQQGAIRLSRPLSDAVNELKNVLQSRFSWSDRLNPDRDNIEDDEYAPIIVSNEEATLDMGE